MTNLLEYSVIYTNRTTNLMSSEYQQAFKKLHQNLCHIYGAQECAFIPGSGTTGMESVARQFASNRVLIIQNGYFSYRWSQIIQTGNISKEVRVIKASFRKENAGYRIQPPSITVVGEVIDSFQPEIVFIAHTETSIGLMVDNLYLKKLSEYCRNNNSLLCVDGIAAGSSWVNMQELGIDIYLTAPQKGWSSPAGCGVVLMGDRSLDKLKEVGQSSSFTLDLKKWLDVSKSYMNDSFMYHCTVPTECIIKFSQNVEEVLKIGLEKLRDNAIYLGKGIRNILSNIGFKCMVDIQYEAPSVIVCLCQENMVPVFKRNGIQVTGYAPFKLGEPDGIQTFRIGLFGVDKLLDPEKTITEFKERLENISSRI